MILSKGIMPIRWYKFVGVAVQRGCCLSRILMASKRGTYSILY